MEKSKSNNQEVSITKNSILFGGTNTCTQFEDASYQFFKNNSIVSPPRELPIDSSSILSYSIQDQHSVIITKEGEAYGIGYKKNTNTFFGPNPYEEMKKYTKIELKDEKGSHIFPISALCLNKCTLFLASKQPNSKDTILIHYDNFTSNYKFLDIGNRKPVALFGGYDNASAIDSEGGIIHLPESFFKSFPSIQFGYLPDNQIAVSVAHSAYRCVIALSASGKLFMSRNFDDKLIFYPVSEFENIKITSIAGNCKKLFAVSEDGRVYIYTTDFKRDCIVEENNDVMTNKFILFDSLSEYKITSVYTGSEHTLFQTNEGKILSCGRNREGQLMLSSISNDFEVLPVETIVSSGALFCIAVDSLSVIFINCDAPNSPNKKISSESLSISKYIKTIHQEIIENKIPSNRCIIFSGLDSFNLCNNDNNMNSSKVIISSPHKLQFDESSISSLSMNYDKLIMITRKGEAFGMGDNSKSHISGSLPEIKIDKLMKIELLDNDSNQLFSISAVCCSKYSLYIVSRMENKNDTFLLCSSKRNRGKPPIILNIGNRKPVALFDYLNSVVIDSEGAIILIDYRNHLKFPDKEIKAYFLPDNERAISVAFVNLQMILLSENGRVFKSGYRNICFTQITELEQIRIKSISGINRCYAISEEGRVYGYAHNYYGLFIFNSNKEFKLIESLNDYNIVAAYTNGYHSLFQTDDGKIIGHGNNHYMQLMLKSDMMRYIYHYPVETIIKEGAKFCIVGNCNSIVFINCDAPNSPNRTIQKNISTLLAENSFLKKENELLKEKIKQISKQKTNSIEKFTFDSSSLDNLKQVDTISHSSKIRVYKVSQEKFFSIKLFVFKNQDNMIRREDHTKLENIFKEYETINCKNHRNIMKMFGHGFGDENHLPWILLEYCQWNLNDVINAMVDIQRICSIIELSEAMHEIHSNGFIHLDLKPSNIFFDDSGHLKLGGIGNYHILDMKEQTEHQFISPELLLGKQDFKEKSDVYSFGVIVFFILTSGEYPDISIVDKINGKEPPIPKNINKFSKEIILKCMSFNPRDRPTFENIINIIKNYKYNLIDGLEDKTQEIIDFIYKI